MSRLELLALLEERERRVKYNQIARYYPAEGPLRRDLYPKHMQAFFYGAHYRERCFQGGNGVGKTQGVGAYETTLHATGDYPDWWPGRRYATPVDIWVGGDTKETVRDITQAKLIGDVAKRGLTDVGTGMLPRAAITENGEFTGKFRQGTNYACDYVRVKHASGGYSTIAFKSYDQRRESFQGTEKDFIWLDEEPPMDIYTECVMRGRTVNGAVLLTFTPLSGPTDVVRSFQTSNKDGASKALVKCTWNDVPHLTEEEKLQMIAACPPYLREARMNGEAVAGTGRIYPVNEQDIVVKPFALPDFWPRVFGIDCGWHRTAVIWGAHDRDNDTLYLYSEHYKGEAEVPIHAAAIKARGIWIPGVGDVAGASQTTGETFIDLYRAQGVRIRLPNKSVDGGIAAVLERMSTGRLKVFSTCENWLNEFRTYSYDDKNRVKKVDDHLMDACVTGDTVVCTTRGSIPIRDLVGTCGEVVTRDGAVAGYIGARLTIKDAPVVTLTFDDGSSVTCTHDHPFLTPHGWVRADRMAGEWCYNGITQAIQSRQWKSSYIQRHAKSLRGLAITCADRIFSAMAFASTGLFGRLQMAGSRPLTITCTTKMGTDQTTQLPTLSSRRQPNTSATISEVLRELWRPMRSRPQRRGTPGQTAGLGMRSTTKDASTPFTPRGSLIANSAARSLPHKITERTNSAPRIADIGRAWRLALTTRNAIAWSAARATWLTATSRNKPARASAQQRCLSKTDAGKADVYCLTVPGVSAFCVGTGQVVHNTRYLIVSGLDIAALKRPPDHGAKMDEQTFGIYSQ